MTDLSTESRSLGHKFGLLLARSTCFCSTTTRAQTGGDTDFAKMTEVGKRTSFSDTQKT